MDASAAIDHAVRACPFLHAVAAKQGLEAARRVATDPFRPAAAPARPPVLTEPATPRAFVGSYRAFHVGPDAIVPLKHGAAPLPVCPFAAAAAAAGGAAARLPSVTDASAAAPPPAAGALEFALEPARASAARACHPAAASAEAAPAALTAPAPQHEAATRARPANGALRRPAITATSAPFASMSLPFLGGLVSWWEALCC
jgi:hypothetical protein